MNSKTIALLLISFFVLSSCANKPLEDKEEYVILTKEEGSVWNLKMTHIENKSFLLTDDGLYSIDNMQDTVLWKYIFSDTFRQNKIFPYKNYLWTNGEHLIVFMNNELFTFSVDGKLIDRWKILEEPIQNVAVNENATHLYFLNRAVGDGAKFGRGLVCIKLADKTAIWNRNLFFTTSFINKETIAFVNNSEYLHNTNILNNWLVLDNEKGDTLTTIALTDSLEVDTTVEGGAIPLVLYSPHYLYLFDITTQTVFWKSEKFQEKASFDEDRAPKYILSDSLLLYKDQNTLHAIDFYKNKKKWSSIFQTEKFNIKINESCFVIFKDYSIVLNANDGVKSATLPVGAEEYSLGTNIFPDLENGVFYRREDTLFHKNEF